MPRSHAQTWECTLEVDGERVTRAITVEPEAPFAQGTAEVRAIKAEEAAGVKHVRCLKSRFIREEP